MNVFFIHAIWIHFVYKMPLVLHQTFVWGWRDLRPPLERIKLSLLITKGVVFQEHATHLPIRFVEGSWLHQIISKKKTTYHLVIFIVLLTEDTDNFFYFFNFFCKYVEATWEIFPSRII